MPNPTTLETRVLGDVRVRSPHYFNGRLLSREDLDAEHKAGRARDQRLGRALGFGIAQGLIVTEISRNQPVIVSVSEGFAVTDCGAVLELTEALTLRLEKPPTPARPTTRADFDDCRTPSGAAPDQAGAYVLTLSAETVTEGRAPVAGLGNRVSPCNAGQRAEGLKFRLVPLSASSVTTGPRARNQLAWQCLGLLDTPVISHRQQPFVLPVPASGFPVLAGGQLTPGEVPLAVVFWSAPGVFEFLDVWSVRRRIARPDSVEDWSLFGGDRRLAVAEASFWQFQDQIEGLIPNANLATAAAGSWFDVLPAGGFLPVGTQRFNAAAFFAEFQVREVESDPALLRLFLAASWHLEPIRVPTSATPLADRPAVEVHRFAGITDFVFFLRTQAPPPVAAPEQGTEQEAVVVTPEPAAEGRIRAYLEFDPLPVPKAGKKLPVVSVKAYDKGGSLVATARLQNAKVDSDWVEPKRTRKIKAGAAIVFTYEFDPVPTGDYTVTATCDDYVADHDLTHVTRNGIAVVELQLKKRTSKGPIRRPDQGAKFEGVLDDRYGNKFKKVWPVPDWWPEEDVTKIRDRWGPRPGCDPLGPEREVMKEVLTDVLEGQDLPVTPGDFEIFIDPSYRAGATSAEPYAVAVFANGGGIPLVLVPAESALPNSVPVSRSGVAEFAELGAESRADLPSEMDVVAALWTGKAATTLGISSSSARSLLHETAAAVETTLNQHTYLPGVTAEFGLALGNAGLSTAALANQTVDQLRVIAREANVNVSNDALGRIIDYAQKAAPTGSWSVGAADLGLSTDQMAKLGTQGIQSLGQLQEALSAGNSQLGTQLGLNAEAVAGLADRVGVELTERAVSFGRESSLSSLAGLASGEAEALVESGVGSMADLAGAKTGEVATALGVSEERAATLIREATVREVSDKSGLSRDQAQQLVTEANVASLTELKTEKLDLARASFGEADLSEARVGLLLNLGSRTGRP